MQDSINWLAEIDGPPKKLKQDPLVDAVISRYNGAVGWLSADRVNGKPVRQVLRECWEQQNSVLSPEDQQRANDLGINVVVNLTALKTGIANAYLNDALVSGGAELPWTISPTPRPDISADSKEELLARLKEALFTDMIPNSDVLVELIRQAKMYFARREQERAEKACVEMEGLIEDQCSEGGFGRAITDFLQYFTPYPYGVFAGPYIVRAPKIVWGQKKPRLSTEIFPVFKAISPFDFCYSPDSPDTQRGTCVFTRELWTRRELLDAAQMSTYIQKNVLDLLEECDHNEAFSLRWLSHAPDAPNRDINLWASNVRPIEVLHHYGLMSGRELSKYGFASLDNKEYYNCEIVMAGYRVIMVKVVRDPRMQIRPVYTASFYRTGGDKIAGDGIAQRLRDIERAYMSNLRYLLRNAYYASAPCVEADYARLSKYLGEGDLGMIVPGTIYLADSGIGSNNPAMRFTSIPANMQGYTELLEMFMQLADRVTNIPAQLHGEAVGSGAMRTFRGMSALQGNATKALHAAVDNITHGVFDPMGHLLYNINMLYSPNVAIKGDSQIMVKGAEGLLHKEMERQSALEILQIIGSVGAQLGQSLNLAPVIGWSMKKLFASMDVPDDVIAAMEQPSPAMMMQGGEAAPGLPGGSPNSNPNPQSEGFDEASEALPA